MATAPAGMLAAAAARQVALSAAAERAEAAAAALQRTTASAASSLSATCAGAARGGGRKPRTGPDAAAEVFRRAAAVGLTGPLGAPRQRRGAFFESLVSSLEAHGREAWNIPLTSTALTWFEIFRSAVGAEAATFAEVTGPTGAAGLVENRRLLDAFTEFCATSPPLGKTRGKCMTADHAQGIAGAIERLRSREARCEVAGPNLVGATALKRKRRLGEMPGSRKLSRAVRLSHFEAAAAGGFDRSSDQGVVDWAAALAAHGLILRGGEVGVPDNCEVDIQRLISWSSLEWQDARAESSWLPWLLVHVVPIKDQRATKKAYPTPIGRRHGGAFGSVPTDLYDALAAAWWRRSAGPGVPFPVDALGRPSPGWWRLPGGSVPLGKAKAAFFTVGGAAFTTTGVRQLFRRVASHSGIPAGEVGAKAGRIGGATDLRAHLGPAGADLVQERGRWDSTVSLVYQRSLAAEQLQASIGLGSKPLSLELEALCLGWADAARR